MVTWSSPSAELLAAMKVELTAGRNSSSLLRGCTGLGADGVGGGGRGRDMVPAVLLLRLSLSCSVRVVISSCAATLTLLSLTHALIHPPRKMRTPTVIPQGEYLSACPTVSDAGGSPHKQGV